jgi:hypothetical protein
MSQVILPDALVHQIEATGVIGSAAVEAFVQQAVSEKLAAEQRRKKFFRLSDEMRAAMEEQGLTEEQLLAEFDSLRHTS